MAAVIVSTLEASNKHMSFRVATQKSATVFVPLAFISKEPDPPKDTHGSRDDRLVRVYAAKQIGRRSPIRLAPSDRRVWELDVLVGSCTTSAEPPSAISSAPAFRSVSQMQMTGHKTRSVFDRYNIVSASDLREAAKRLDNATGTISGTIEKNQRSASKA